MKKLKKILALVTTAAMLAASSAIPVFAADAAQLCDEPAQVEAIAVSAVDEADEAVEVVDEVELTTADEGIMTLSEADTSLPSAENGVITLTNDVALATSAVISGTLDLNGHSITRGDGNTTSYLIGVASGASLTVKDSSESAAGYIYSSNYTKDSGTYAGYGILTNGSVTVESGTVQGYYGIYVSGDSASLTVDGGTVSSSNTYAVYAYSGAVTVTKGTVSGYCGIYVNENASLTVNGGKVSGNVYGINSKGTVNISGGEVIATVYYAIYNTGTATISGGTVTASYDTTSQGFAVCNYATLNITGGTFVAKDDGIFNIGTSAVATISGDDTTITCNSGVGIYTTNGATLTVDSGTITGATGIVVYGDSTNTTTLVVNGGTITGGDEGFGISTNGSSSAGMCEITVNGGTISGAWGMYLPAVDSTTTITGGTITGSCTAIEIRAGVLNVSGGTITSTYDDEAEISSNGSGTTIIGAGIAVSQHSTNQTVTVNITGGEISGYYGVCEANTYSNNTSDVTVTISGDTTVETTSEDSGSAVYSSSISSTTENDGTAYGTDHTTVTITSGTYNTSVEEYTASNHYQDEDTGDVILASTIVTDNGKYTLDGGSTATITLDDLETNLKTTTWTDTTDYHTSGDCVYDATEVATIDVVLGVKDAATVQTEYSGVISAKGDDDFAVDISVVKTYSDGTEEIVPVKNQTVTITTPTSVSSVSGIYHITDGTATAVSSDNYSKEGNTITLNAQSFSTYYFGLTLASVAEEDITDTVTLNLTEVTAGVPGTYYITLDAADDKYINRFMAAELAFVLDDTLDITNIGAVSITPADYISIINSGNGEYEFNVKDTDGVVYGITDNSILLGTMTITGSGYFSISLLDDDKLLTNTANQAQTAEYSNNIVSTYTLADATLSGAAPLASGEITLPQTQLTINVLFPNTVSAQAADYNDMTVTVTGMGVDKELNLGGTKLTADDVDITSVSGSDYEDATGYTETVTVTTGYAYTLVFEGAGYRTYRTSITPSGGTATVTVWNNAMDSNMYVATSTDNAMGAVTDDVTFLAGDIVANNVIDLWDLSAVVSYFGKAATDEELTAAWDYTMYDLNRDGKIDSRDIAMVLVSWDY